MTSIAPEQDTQAAPQSTRQNDGETLNDVAAMTRLMREHQEQITRIGQERRKKVLHLRQHRVTYREIATAMNVTEQAVYKIIRGDL